MKDNNASPKLAKNQLLWGIIIVLAGLVVFFAARSTNEQDSDNTPIIIDDAPTFSDIYSGEEIERWDPNSCVYSNYKYGFVWVLPSDLEWHYVAGTSKHTIFKVVEPVTQMTVYANITSYEGVDLRNVDFWDGFETMKKARQEANGIMQANGGDQINDISFEKCTFCNRHAAKEYFENTMDDDRYDEPVKISALSYHFYHYNYSFTITVKCYKEIYDLLGNDGIMQYFKGFNLIPIQEEKTIETINNHSNNKAITL